MRESHDENVANATEFAKKDGRQAIVNGVKGNSFLNKLKYYNTLEGLPLDAMHDILEGCARVHLKCLMSYLKDNKVYNSEMLNRDLSNFSYGRSDSANKVPNNYFSDEKSCNLSATHMWTLMRIFPLLCGEKLKNHSLYISNFNQLHTIFRIIYSTSFTLDSLNNLSDLIESYLNNFLKLYSPIYVKSLTAKQHFLIHYPTCIRRFGPPRYYSTMRFESKHKQFKNIIKSVNNFVNLLYSMADRHQKIQAYHLMSPCYFPKLEFGTRDKLSRDERHVAEVILDSTNLIFLNWVEKRGIRYHKGDFVIGSFDRGKPVFARINRVALIDREIKFLITKFESIGYDDYLCAYNIREPESSDQVLAITNLKSIWPLDSYKKHDGTILIILKHNV